LDSYPGTAPDNNLESRDWETLQSIANDGTAQLLRANSSVSSPHTYAVFSQVNENFTVGDNIRVRVALAELGSDYDDLMGIKVYLINVTEDGSITAFDNEAAAITTIANISRDIRYAEHMTSAIIYEFNLEVTSSTTDDAKDIYVVVAGITTDTDNRNNLSIAASTTTVDNQTKCFVCNNSNSCPEKTNTLDYAIEVKKQDGGDVWDIQYNNLNDGTYYFHAKAKDNAGNWGDTEHFTINIDTEGVAVDIIEPFTGQVFSNPNIEVEVEVDDQANVSVIALHPDGTNDTSSIVLVNDTYTFNITLENGTNEIYAKAINPDNNVITYSQSVFVRLGIEVPEANKTLRVSYGTAGVLGTGTHICGVDEGTTTVGMATENDAAPCGGTNIIADTETYTIKIFATTDSMDVDDVEDDLEDDDFLDRINPMFGYEKGIPYYVVRTEVRPVNIYFTGEKKLSSGKYTLVFKNVGTTTDGKTNVTMTVV
jgi:hypothetical protein